MESGCKWTLEKLFAFLSEQGHNTQRLWRRITRLVLLTVLPLAGHVPEDPLCWELFGFGRLLTGHSNKRFDCCFALLMLACRCAAGL